MHSRIPGFLVLAVLILIGSASGLSAPTPGQIADSPAQSQESPATNTVAPAENATSPGTSGTQEAAPETPASQKIESKTEKIKVWRQAALQHRSGHPDSAAVQIGAWRTKDLESVFSFISKLAAQTPSSLKHTLAKASSRQMLQLSDQEAQQGDLSRVLKQGALLHTDIAMLDLGTSEFHDAREGMGAFIDGHIFVFPKTPHWEYARRLIDLVSPSPSRDPAVLRWYLATIAFMEERGLLGYAGHNIEHALEKFPADPGILFYAGTLHETWASPAHQNVMQSAGAKVLYGSKEAELKLAKQFFEKAVTLNPNLSEARLHLGRVLGLLGNHENAVAQLQQASAALNDRQRSYYAALYLGLEFEMLCRRSEARAQYERAAELYPAAQSPLLALSQLARSEDDVKSALTALDRVFALPRGDLWKDDPWWVYNQAHARDSVALIDEMYRILGERPQ
jgi:tetratricopeptide (TPR) repeat protein